MSVWRSLDQLRHEKQHSVKAGEGIGPLLEFCSADHVGIIRLVALVAACGHRRFHVPLSGGGFVRYQKRQERCRQRPRVFEEKDSRHLAEAHNGYG